MNHSRLKPTLGWLVVVLGCVAIILVGFLNPTCSPVHLAQAYWPVYGAAVVVTALGVLVITDS